MTKVSSHSSARRRVLVGTACVLLISAGIAWCVAPHTIVGAASGDIMIADFDGLTYAPGWTTTGTAFGTGPARGTLPNQMEVSGFKGEGLVNSYLGGDASIGTLTSPPFTVNRTYLSFLIGGGNHPSETRIDLVVDGVVQRTSTGADSEQLSWRQWDVSALKGTIAVLRISDTATGSWGHINVDDIRLTDTKLPDERTLAVASATNAITAAIPTAVADARRPAYHYHAPAQWMNDPNGPIYYKGWYHLFYQFNPYGSKWGNMHWGHARSKDLVNWVQMPVALWPSKDEGEDHVYSGSTFLRSDGTAMAFYTSIGARDPEQWGAVSQSPGLAVWTKSAGDPLLTGALHGSDKVVEWRDPFLFTKDNITYLLTGGGIGEHGVVCLYQATSVDLTHWKYLGPVFKHPDADVRNVECPNLAYIDGKWLLLTSTHGKVEYFVGQLDLAGRKFITEKRGVLADGSYASQLVRPPDGSIVHLAWMHTEEGSGWNGYVTLPSTLRISPDGTVRRLPIAKLGSLRGRHVQIVDRPVVGALDLSRRISGRSLEVDADIDPGTAHGVTLNLGAVAIKYDVPTHTLTVPGRDPEVLPVSQVRDLKLRIFVDNGALDVYAADGAVTLASFLADPPHSDSGLRITASSGSATIKRLDIYEMKPAMFDNSAYSRESSLGDGQK